MMQKRISQPSHTALTSCRTPLPRLRCQCRLVRPSAAVQEAWTLEQQEAVLPTDDAAWAAFSSNVSGEWEGVTATFSPTGEPQQLPENFVPEAFREWGVELRDWQSQCSSTTTDKPKQLQSLLRRLMPTVGCEADAIAFTEEASGSSGSSNSITPTDGTSSSSTSSSSTMLLLAAADGSYSTGPLIAPVATEGLTQLQVEHCFMLPSSSSSSSSSSSGDCGSDNKLRIKVVQKFRRNWAVEGAWKLTEVDLHKEKYDGPFTGKRELAGCGGGQPGIALLPALQQQQLLQQQQTCWSISQQHSSLLYALNTSTGKLEPTSTSSASTSSGSVSCLLEMASAAAASDGGSTSSCSVHLALLPLGAWSVVELTSSGQLQRSEAGVLLDDQQQQNGSSSSRMVSVRSYGQDGRPLVAALVVEQASQK